MKKAITTKVKRNIPSIPFDGYEVHALTHEASNELLNRLSHWKASNDYHIIKSLEVKFKNNKLPRQEKDLYLDWLVSIESDKFKALDEVQLIRVSLSNEAEAENEDLEHEEQRIAEIYG